jgi:outer membrane protein assembly factor BamB
VFLAFLWAIVLVVQAPARAEDWPAWRGPRGDGTSSETDVPTKWSSTDNVAWKTPLPGVGHSSPIVWGDSIFLTTAFVETKDRALICLDRKTGEILWRQDVVRAPLEAKQQDNSYASSTPATDGERVYVAFLDGKDVVVAAYDFAGQQKWMVRPGQFDSKWGFATSPVLFGDKVLIACPGIKAGFIAALGRKDGKTLWRVEPKRLGQSFSTPLVRPMAGRAQMVIPTSSRVTSYDPQDGAVLWAIDAPSREFVAAPVFSEKAGLVLCATSWPAQILLAINPDGHGEVTKEKVAWTTQEGAPYVPSAIAVDEWFLVSSAQKELTCYEAASGKIVWKQAEVGLDYASPIAANGLVYFPSQDGIMTVVKPGPKYEVVARNALGERTFASPAVSRGQIFLRSFTSLYCIGAAK